MRKKIKIRQALTSIFFVLTSYAMENSIPSLAELAARKVPQSQELPEDLQAIIARQQLYNAKNETLPTILRCGIKQERALPLKKGHLSRLLRTIQSPDGAHFVTIACQNEQEIKLSNMRDGTCTRYKETFPIYTGCWDGENRLVVAGASPKINVLQISQHGLSLIREMGGNKRASHHASILVAQLDRKKKKLLTTSYDKTLKVWDYENGTLLMGANCFAVYLDGVWLEKNFVVISDQNEVVIIDENSGVALKKIQSYIGNKFPWRMNLSDDDRYAFVADESGWLKRFDLITGKIRRKKLGKRVYRAIPLKDGNVVVQYLPNRPGGGQVVIMSPDLKTVVKTIPRGPKDLIETITVSADKNQLLVLSLIWWTQQRSMQLYTIFDEEMKHFLTKKATVAQLSLITKIIKNYENNSQSLIQKNSLLFEVLLTLPRNVQMALTKAGLRVMSAEVNQ